MPKALSRTVRADAIAWNDVEALPLHGATLLLFALAVFALADIGDALHSTGVTTAGIVGCLGLRAAWLGMDGPGAGTR